MVSIAMFRTIHQRANALGKPQVGFSVCTSCKSVQRYLELAEICCPAGCALQIQSLSQAITALHAAGDPEAYLHASQLMHCVHEAVSESRLSSPRNPGEAVFVKKLLQVGQVPAVVHLAWSCTAACLRSFGSQRRLLAVHS